MFLNLCSHAGQVTIREAFMAASGLPDVVLPTPSRGSSLQRPAPVWLSVTLTLSLPRFPAL